MPLSPAFKGPEKAALCPPSLPSSLTDYMEVQSSQRTQVSPRAPPHPCRPHWPLCGQPSQPTSTSHGGLCRAGACGSRERHVLGLPGLLHECKLGELGLRPVIVSLGRIYLEHMPGDA